ncbi:hypothetical protein SLNSH_06335 [Alsobacter soli]|uniref:DUF2189 domain-containing protein n=1 Tax=Alsobacter soli TaxID=2109933 RepID=A0A2T1HWV1_9HYPH|nr:DUF2189 domain-containing protein [Alsobacter soli]PSC05989.1 hypothetical protein SLNSH_06335 [Alsobacter soli]
MTLLPATQPPLPRLRPFERHLPPTRACAWLAGGWSDLWAAPWPSLAYGFAIFFASASLVGGMLFSGWDYILFPALAGFMVVGPLLATGLYEKSRRLEAGEPVRLADLLRVRAASGGQILFVGVLLCVLFLLWMRAAVIVYALFFGLRPFPGLGHVTAMLFTTPTGWTMLVVGSVVGSLFASFAFAVSVIAVPMLLAEQVDAFTAMGRSVALVWNNLPVMLAWGVIALAVFLLCVASGMAGLVIGFPLLGHGTWRAYRDVWSRS